MGIGSWISEKVNGACVAAKSKIKDCIFGFTGEFENPIYSTDKGLLEFWPRNYLKAYNTILDEIAVSSSNNKDGRTLADANIQKFKCKVLPEVNKVLNCIRLLNSTVNSSVDGSKSKCMKWTDDDVKKLGNDIEDLVANFLKKFEGLTVCLNEKHKASMQKLLDSEKKSLGILKDTMILKVNSERGQVKTDLTSANATRDRVRKIMETAFKTIIAETDKCLNKSGMNNAMSLRFPSSVGSIMQYQKVSLEVFIYMSKILAQNSLDNLDEVVPADSSKKLKYSALGIKAPGDEIRTIDDSRNFTYDNIMKKLKEN